MFAHDDMLAKKYDNITYWTIQKQNITYNWRYQAIVKKIYQSEKKLLIDTPLYFEKQPPEVLYKKVFLKISQN